MNNLTKFKINRPARELFEAFADPAKIGCFWFSSSSERWEQGKTITLRYEEYNAVVDMKMLEIEADKRIVFQWAGEANIVTITLEEQEDGGTIIAVLEDGFQENDPELISKIVDNKEGWVFVLSCLKAYLESGVTTLRAGIAR
ncbi:SRPBCC family protein [Paenibacillus silvisoli]|uniref:SRPBCC family protein n=1 Tax=Paenibacillus silvisoli TaxID=3110539 RepID=UPI002805A349|nr:SRPBCC family protein [Paenibacillus silvisoli]